MYTHILFPTDGSDCARHALPQLIALARAYNARVTVLHAVQTPFPSAPALGLSPGQAFSVQEVSEAFERQGHGLLESTVAALTEAGLAAEGLLSHMDPREALQEAAAATRCDLIVMGTHTHHALRRVLLGSVSSYAVHHTHVPLLLIPFHEQHKK